MPFIQNLSKAVKKMAIRKEIVDKIWKDWEAFRLLCLQQIALDLLCFGRVSNCLFESAPPCRIYGFRFDAQQKRYFEIDLFPSGMQTHECGSTWPGCERKFF